MLDSFTRCTKAVLLGTVVILIGALAAGAQPIPRGKREVKTHSTRYKGIQANSEIPAQYHVQNEGGSDGAGLCVIASLLQNGQVQGVPAARGGKASALWRTAKSRPGGYSPDKLAALLKEKCPDEKYASYVGTNFKVLEKMSERKIPVAGTMSTGELYNWQPIHHFVSWEHFSEKDGTACVQDDNDANETDANGKKVAVHRWMTVTEAKKRLMDGGSYWAFAWLRSVKQSPTAQTSGAAALLAAAAAAVALVHKRRSEEWGDNGIETV